MADPEVGSPRRYFLLKRQAALKDNSPALAGTWRWRQEQEPATSLPEWFPFVEQLAEAGYTAQEDLAGADLDELLDQLPNLSTKDAEGILAARNDL